LSLTCAMLATLRSTPQKELLLLGLEIDLETLLRRWEKQGADYLMVVAPMWVLEATQVALSNEIECSPKAETNSLRWFRLRFTYVGPYARYCHGSQRGFGKWDYHKGDQRELSRLILGKTYPDALYHAYCTDRLCAVPPALSQSLPQSRSKLSPHRRLERSFNTAGTV